MRLSLEQCAAWMGGRLIATAGNFTTSPNPHLTGAPDLASETWSMTLPPRLAVTRDTGNTPDEMNGELLDYEATAGFGSEQATGYSINSRTVAPGELFFAVAGDRFDAHQFVAGALGSGAVAAVVAEDRLHLLGPAAGPLIVVDDPLSALQRLGAAVRQQWGGTLVGVTGSAGKTTTKEMVAAVLGAGHRVLKSAGNLNNHFGVPLQLLRLEPEDRYAVIEMGMSAAGEIALLAALARPNWGVVTNVGVAHAANFPDGIEGIARAKRELVEALPPDGIAFLNADDPRVAAFAQAFAGRSILVGLDEGAAVRAATVDERGAEGLSMLVEAREDRMPGYAAGREAVGPADAVTSAPSALPTEVHLQFLGAHNAGNALLALAVGFAAGVPLAQGAAALAALAPGDRRGELIEHAGARILNDCYNANPAAMSAMIHALAGLPAERHILVAGEMLELGPDTGTLHAACGAQAAAAGVDWVIGVQGAALALAEEAARHGTRALFLETAEDAGAWLRRELRPGDAVLIKGSRGVHLGACSCDTYGRVAGAAVHTLAGSLLSLHLSGNHPTPEPRILTAMHHAELPEPTRPLRRDLVLLCALASTLLALHILMGNGYGFHRDELQFLDDARHLGWGFAAYPPLTAFSGRLAIGLFGISPGVFRLPAALVNACTLVLAGLMARQLGGRRFAQVTAVCAAFPVALLFSSVLQYNTFDFLAWNLILVFTLSVLRTGNSRFWARRGRGRRHRRALEVLGRHPSRRPAPRPRAAAQPAPSPPQPLVLGRGPRGCSHRGAQPAVARAPPLPNPPNGAFHSHA